MTGQYNRVFHHIIRVEVIDIGVNISKNASNKTIETVSVYNSTIRFTFTIVC